MSDLEDLANRSLPDVETTSPLDTKRSTEPGEIGDLQNIVAHGDTNELLNHDTGFFKDMANFAKFTGHGLNRGISETFGMPVDSWNAAGEFLKNHPSIEQAALGIPLAGPFVAAQKLSGHAHIPAGGTETFTNLAHKMGAPTSTPEEEGDRSASAHWGDTLGEFAGANVPFLYAAPEKMMVGGVQKTVPNLVRLLKSEHPFREGLHDFFAGAIGPGIGAIVGEEFTGDEHKDLGKAVGGIVGGVRLFPIEAGLTAAKSGASWLHDFLGFGTGARTKVSESLASGAQDLPAAASNVEKILELSPGAKIPVDIKSKDEGLLALRRSVMAKDAQLSGDYRRMQKATQHAIQEDAKYSPANYPDAYSWLNAKQKSLEDLINRRQLQAVEDADRSVEQAFQGVSPNQVDANTVKNAYATTLRKQLLLARDDANAVVESKWAKVDKEMPVDMNAVYDEINTMKAEHEARPGQSDQRFPNEFVDRFYKTEKGEDGKSVKLPKFGTQTPLQDVIDLHSEVSQAMREQSAKDAPDRVYMGYLTQLSKSLQRAKESMPWAGLPVFKDANQATKTFHETFSQGPVGQVLGHDVPGAPDIFPGDTIRHFLTQGPAGIDNFNSLMRAVSKRTGQTTPLNGQPHVPPTAQMPQLLRQYIRQDFYDNVMPNGVFNKRAAEQWLRNNSGPLLHFEDIRKEFEKVVETKGQAAVADKVNKQALDDLRASRAGLFLKGEPGKLFNGAVDSHDKYAATKELMTMVKEDPTHRAIEGLGQMALDHMIATSFSADKTSMDLQRLNGTKVNQWYDKNKGVIRALDEALPGIKDRFKRMADTARYLEGFNVNPKVPQEEASKVLMIRDVLARIMGANVFSRFGHRGGSIQTAAIGSQAFKQLAAKLTPDQAMAVFRRAMVEPEFFKALTTEITEKNAKMQFRVIQPYMYSMGIPMVQPLFQEDREPEKKAVNE